MDRYDPGSFRDRSSRVFTIRTSVRRGLDARALADWQTLTDSGLYERLVAAGRIVRTHRIDAEAGDWAAVVEHQRVPVVSYPFEWPFGMLKDAALLHLDVLAEATAAGMTLSDGSAYNVQWIGSSPVFIDTPSFVRQDRPRPWYGYRQFCQQFLYPLMLQAYRGMPFQPWLRGRLDGLRADDLRGLFSARDWLRPGVFVHFWLQDWLQRLLADAAGSTRELPYDIAAALAQVKRLRRIVERLTWRVPETAWTGYQMETSYDTAGRAAKERFVIAVLSERRRRLVWDLGCNHGEFARLAGGHADAVVAADADAATVERLYHRLKSDGNRRVLPLVLDVADPSPGLGWRNVERLPLIERGRPDLVIALALIHHLVIGANLRLGDFVDWLADLGGEVLIEFVDRTDPMVKQLLAGRDDVFTDYDRAAFEAHLARRFPVVRREPLPGGTRTLYHARPREVS